MNLKNYIKLSFCSYLLDFGSDHIGISLTLVFISANKIRN